MVEVWETVGTTVGQEFSDIPDMAELTRVALRLLVAVVLGGLIGYERETRGMAAGLRTHMLVALGAALFVLAPLQAGMKTEDLSRVLQGVISGIGFLGAGAIIKLHNENEIRGLTTAASIWLTSAVGISAGMGREATAVFTTVLALVILAALRKMTHAHRARIAEHAQDDKPAGRDAPPPDDTPPISERS